MKYRYKKGQIFRKRLNLDKSILKKIYNSSLSFKEYMEYNLIDKVPSTCLNQRDKEIFDLFGFHKCTRLDWDLVNFYDHRNSVYMRDYLLKIDPNIFDINDAFYDAVKDVIDLRDYTAGMKEKFSDRFVDVYEEDSEQVKRIKNRFNEGKLSLSEICSYWDLFKEKDISCCLKNDSDNIYSFSCDNVKEFMDNYALLVPLINNYDNIYNFINSVNSLNSINEKNSYIKKFTDYILKYTDEKRHYYKRKELIEKDLYKEIFKYSSLKDYLSEINAYQADNLFNELKYLPKNYIFECGIPFNDILKPDVFYIISTYGLKNIADFCKENGSFLLDDDSYFLKNMYDKYLRFDVNKYTSKNSFRIKNVTDNSMYSKKEFYEVIRRMLIYGPTTSKDNKDEAIDYSSINGEFRKLNPDLFLSNDAPEELKKLFYTKSLTSDDIINNLDYIKYLKGKNLGSCFKKIDVFFEDSTSDLLYNFINEKVGYTDTIKFILEYRDILDESYKISSLNNGYYVTFNKDDDFSKIENRLNEAYRDYLIKRSVSYPKMIPESFRKRYKNLFLDDSSPNELKEALYNRKIDAKFIENNPDYIKYLKDVDLEVLFKYMPILYKGNSYTSSANLIKVITDKFDKEYSFNIMLKYGKYIEKVYEFNKFSKLDVNYYTPGTELIDKLDKNIYIGIVDGQMEYDSNISQSFKEKYPNLFLDDNVSPSLKNKFYSRNFTIEDFENNEGLLDEFGNTNVVCGFAVLFSWMIPLFDKEVNQKHANMKRLKLIKGYLNVEDIDLREVFKDYVTENIDKIDDDKIDYISEVLKRISYSNSSEMYAFRKELATQILNTDNPIDSLNKIEDTFTKTNIPVVGKVYSCFEILHPDFKGFEFENSKLSPTLKNVSLKSRKAIVFSDLIKAAIGSNNKSFNNYLKNLEHGNELYKKINNNYDYEKLSDTEKDTLDKFTKHLIALYNKSLNVGNDSEVFVSSGNILLDLSELKRILSPDGGLDYDLADRAVRMFCGFIGIDSVDELKKYINDKISFADNRNRIASKNDMILERGDYVKGIGSIKYLRNILQNGSVSKEYLGSSAGSDSTPLDTDVSKILLENGSNEEKLTNLASEAYGPIWFVLKNDDRFMTTRDNVEEYDMKKNLSKLEVFYTGIISSNHYGIRTGFSSSDINYIMVDEYDSRIGLEIALNGFYIPVFTRSGKILFTPEDYDKIRESMNGLSYYDRSDYKFSTNLINEDVINISKDIDKSILDVSSKKEKINDIFKDTFKELELKLKNGIDGDLTEGYVEIIDTGSTGRGTNKPGDGDFDFMLRLDKKIISNKERLDVLRKKLLEVFKTDSYIITGEGDLRLKNVLIGNNTYVDVDITFAKRTDSLSYSTDMALQDRLNTIKGISEEKYKYVLSNILLAKKILKEVGVYKPNRGEVPQGGLGGVGVENWILQNGGSFVDAARSFVDASKNKSFEEFKKTYFVWDFGDNHLAEKRGYYPHDNFVDNNMSSDGYQKMVFALEAYLEKEEIKSMENDDEYKM